jgi:hypothetical protein
MNAAAEGGSNDGLAVRRAEELDPLGRSRLILQTLIYTRRFCCT